VYLCGLSFENYFQSVLCGTNQRPAVFGDSERVGHRSFAGQTRSINAYPLGKYWLKSLYWIAGPPSRDTEVSTGIPGPIVVEMTDFLMKRPLDELGLERTTSSIAAA